MREAPLLSVQPFVGAADPHRESRGDGNQVIDDELYYMGNKIIKNEQRDKNQEGSE